MTWEMHRRAGLEVEASTPTVTEGALVVLGLGFGHLRVWQPGLVVYVVNEPTRQGYAYGTLPGHPDRGEERFTTELQEDQTILLRIVAFSRPATWWARLGAPVHRVVQGAVTDRYLAALSVR